MKIFLIALAVGMARGFHQGHEYLFNYNGQIAIDDNQAEAEKSITRFQCQVKITFASNRHGQLCLGQIRAGQLNAPFKNEPQCQPMSIFELKKIPSNMKRELEHCCQFDYADGMIERLQFDHKDRTWSKNMKRGILQLIQLNLKRKNIEGLRSDQQKKAKEDQNEETRQKNEENEPLDQSFTIPEINVEGQCQTLYTINKAQRCAPNRNTPCSFSVTKSINFKQCSKIADVSFGYETQQCDHKEVKEQKVERSTVLRYLLKCGEQQQGKEQQNCTRCCQLERTDLLSQYTYKTENGQYLSAMHTFVCAQLQLHSVQPQQQVFTLSSDADESLMYSNKWEIDEKRFYMFGDEEYPDEKNLPFHQVPKLQQATQALRKCVQNAQEIEPNQQKQQQEIEPQQAIQLQRLVQMLRMCSQLELRQIQEQADQYQQDQQKVRQIFLHALAICGTRNCVNHLAEKIKKQEMPPAKCAQALSQLKNLPAPSDTIVQIVHQLCQSEQVKGHSALKQSCWLTFGALVNELCRHNTQENTQQSVFGVQSGFQQQEQCPKDKKRQYNLAILEQFGHAQTIYDKILALSALGNAGIDTKNLEEIIKNKWEQRVVRVKAIDALRRLRIQQPRQIQQILLPIFQNVNEHPQVRTMAFAILANTLPVESVVDQMAYSILQESNKQVQAFAYRTMMMLANQMHEQTSQHIKNALKFANIDEQLLDASGKWHIPLFSKQLQGGLFIRLGSIITQLYLMEQEADQWFEKAMFRLVRGQRCLSSDSDYNGGRSQLCATYDALGTMSRNSSNNEQKQQRFAMVCMRTDDVDQAFFAVEEQKDAKGQTHPIQEAAIFAINLKEEKMIIPTAMGVPLRLINSVPVMASDLKIERENGSVGVKINFQAMANGIEGCLGNPFCTGACIAACTPLIETPLYEICIAGCIGTTPPTKGQKTNVTVHAVGSISVRFDGCKAWLKVSNAENEWRMGNNQIASNLSQFHRSYAHECSQEDFDKLDGIHINKRYQQQGDGYEEEDDQQNGRRMEEDVGEADLDWQQGNLNGNYASSEEMEADLFFNNDCNGNNCRRLGKTQQQPVQKTMVVEMNHHACFSTVPVKKCPHGTVPSERIANNGSGSHMNKQGGNTSITKKNVAFVCMNRFSQEARRLLRQHRQGQKVLNVNGHGQSYVEKVLEHQSCRRPH